MTIKLKPGMLIKDASSEHTYKYKGDGRLVSLQTGTVWVYHDSRIIEWIEQGFMEIKGDKVTYVEKMQAIYDKEQNLVISWFWDGGVNVSLGDNVNGFTNTRHFDTVAEAVDWAYTQTMDKT